MYDVFIGYKFVLEYFIFSTEKTKLKKRYYLILLYIIILYLYTTLSREKIYYMKII